MADPFTLATLGLNALPMASKLLGGLGGGGGGGSTPSVTKQENNQSTAINISVGGLSDAVLSRTPFPGAVNASFATPIGYSAEAYPSSTGFSGMLEANWVPIAAVLAGIIVYKVAH